MEAQKGTLSMLMTKEIQEGNKARQRATKGSTCGTSAE